MKRIVLILVFLAAAGMNLHSQMPGLDDTSGEKKDDKSFRDKFYASGAVRYSEMLDDHGVEIGGSIGIMPLEVLGIGAGFHSLLTHTVDMPGEDFLRGSFLRLNYFGPEIKFKYRFLDDFHFTLETIFALAYANYASQSSFDLPNDPEGKWFFLTEPTFTINYRVSGNFWIGLSAGYKLPLGFEYNSLENDDMTGASFGLIVKVL